jgi:hypothetical protein
MHMKPLVGILVGIATSCVAVAHAAASVSTSTSTQRLVSSTSANPPPAKNDTTTTINASSQNICTPPSSSAYRTLEAILAHDYEFLDPIVLERCIQALQARGAHRCWHKHSTFLEHLLGVHHILHLWGQGTTIGRVSLFHSAYSNSYVNLALYDPVQERSVMRELVGDEAEELVYLFCIIDRQAVVVNTLLQQGYIPKEGLHVPHLRNKDETVYLSPETLRMPIVFTMADTSDQYFGWQDALFGGGGNAGSMIVPGHDTPERHVSTALWPGVSRPGLWMSYVSQLARVARTFSPEWHTTATNGSIPHVPPVFDYGTKELTVQDEATARDLYWSVVMSEDPDDETMITTLRQCIHHNPWAFEPLVLLGQKLLHQGQFDEATSVTQRALELQQQWGTCWDKRMSLGAWVAWTRVLHQRASDHQAWPTNSWDVNNFGLVK